VELHYESNEGTDAKVRVLACVLFFVFFPFSFSLLFRKRQYRLDHRSSEQLYWKGFWSLCGENRHAKNLAMAKNFFGQSNSEEAQFFLSILNGIDNMNESALKKAFEEGEDGTGRGFYVAAFQCQFNTKEHLNYIQKSVENGYSYAMVVLAQYSNGKVSSDFCCNFFLLIECFLVFPSR
jgi:hypothetical protein